jgi:hypothetical protein
MDEHQWQAGNGLGDRYKVTRQSPNVLWQAPDGKWYPATNELNKSREILRLAEENEALLQGIAKVPELEQAILARVRESLLAGLDTAFDEMPHISWNANETAYHARKAIEDLVDRSCPAADDGHEDQAQETTSPSTTSS